jgi:MraZ protein
MLLFTGEHTNKVDRKGRVSLPADFRAELPDGDDRYIYVYPAPRKAFALEAINRAQLEVRVESIDSFGIYTPEQEYFSTVILNRARKLSIDGDGRIVLPAEFLDHAKIDAEAMFVGGGKQFHIWRPERCREYMLEAMRSTAGFVLPPTRLEP